MDVSELLKAEQKEEKVSCNGMEEEEGIAEPPSADGGKKNTKKDKKKKDKKNKNMDNKDKEIEDIKSEVRKSSNEDSDSEEAEFWMPPVGDRWDFDDGGDRWGSGTESEQESEEEGDAIGMFVCHAHLHWFIFNKSI